MLSPLRTETRQGAEAKQATDNDYVISMSAAAVF
jgi:hypothetical protein